MRVRQRPEGVSAGVSRIGVHDLKHKDVKEDEPNDAVGLVSSEITSSILVAPPSVAWSFGGKLVVNFPPK
jgi:hypothetical protein